MVSSSIAMASGLRLVRPRSLSCAARELTQKSMERLLRWLHPDREQAGREYELIRRKLIKIFAVRGCDCSEDLADETIDRVISRLEDIAGGYQGDPSLYFYGVARNVLRVYGRIRKPPPLPSSPDTAASVQPELDCLESCLARLLPQNRDLLVEYYQEDGGAKIKHRRILACRHNLEMNALRIRVFRIRSAVAECTTACLQHQKTPQASMP